MSFGDLKVQDLIYEDSSNNEITVVIADLATKNNPVFTGTVTVPTASASDVSTKAASTAFVDAYYATKVAPAFTGSATGVNLTLSGNLVVNGTTTTVNTENLEVKDKNIIVGKVSTPSDTTADGGGITLLGSSNKTFNWVNATDAWTSSEHIYLGDNKKLLLGVGAGGIQDLSVYSNGSEGILETQSGGTIKLKCATGSSSTDTFATFSGAASQIDLFKSVFFQGNSNNIVWDKPNDSLYFTDNAKIRLGQGSGVAGDLLLYSDGTQGVFDGDIKLNSALPIVFDKSDSLLWFKTSSNGGASAKAWWGDGISYGNLEILMNQGGPAIIQTYNTNLQIASGNSSDINLLTSKDINLINSAGSTNYYLRCVENTGGDQYVELHCGVGGSSKKLETTVTGVNVIGALTINGSALSAAPEVTLTASEAITAEDAIMVKTNGQAEKITGVNSGLSAIQNLDSMNYGAACICYDENANQWVALFYDRENSDRLTGKVGTISNGSTITWGNKCQISTDLTDSDSSKNNIEMVYNPALSRITYFTRNGSQNGITKCGHLTVSGTGSSATVSNAHSNNIANNNSQHRRAVYGSAQLKLVAVYGESTNRPQIMRIDVSSLTSINDAQRMDVTSYNTGYSGPDIAYNGSCYAVSFRNNTSKPAVRCLRHYTWSWVGSITEISSSSIASSYTAPKIAWDSVNDKFLAIYNTNQGLVGDIFTANSLGAVASGTEFLISSDDHTDMGLYELSYNAVAGAFIVVYTGKSSTNTYLRMMKYNSSTNQCDMDAQIQIQNSATSDFATVGNDPDNNVFGILYNRDNTSQKLGNSVVYTPSNTNMDPTRFIGFAGSSVSSGAEVTVKINSNTSTRSGLTPASTYYVQGDGSLGTTAAGDGTIKAGIALSATKLLIQG